MKKYLALYMAPQSLRDEWANTPKEEKSKGMEEWMAWQEANKDSIVEFGNPVGGGKKATATSIEDISNDILGYTIIQANSHEEAVKIMQTNPHIKENGAWVEVMECMDMPN